MEEQFSTMEGRARLRDLQASDIEREQREEREKRNKGFTQIYGRGFNRLHELIVVNASAARLYLLLAEHMDGTGALVASQEVLAEYLCVTTRTISRLTIVLEREEALFRIRVGSGVYCYALDPDEVWKAWNSSKTTAIFNTKTLVSKKDRQNGTVNKRLATMFKERRKE